MVILRCDRILYISEQTNHFRTEKKMATFRPVFSALRTLNQYHTKQLFYQATRKNVFIFKLFQNTKMLPLLCKRSFSSSPIMSSKDSEEADLEKEESDTEDDGEVNSEEDFINKYAILTVCCCLYCKPCAGTWTPRTDQEKFLLKFPLNTWKVWHLKQPMAMIRCGKSTEEIFQYDT